MKNESEDKKNFEDQEDPKQTGKVDGINYG